MMVRVVSSLDFPGGVYTFVPDSNLSMWFICYDKWNDPFPITRRDFLNRVESI